MTTICIDSRFYNAQEGIGRYVRNLILNLPSSPAVRVVLLKDCIFHPYSIFAQLELPLRLLLIHPDLLHVPHDSPPLLWFGKTILTIHDLTKLQSTGMNTTTLPPWLYHLKHLGYNLLLRLSLYKAIHIIVPSLYVQADLIKTFHLHPTKITVTYEGVDATFS